MSVADAYPSAAHGATKWLYFAARQFHSLSSNRTSRILGMPSCQSELPQPQFQLHPFSTRKLSANLSAADPLLLT